MPVIDLRLTDKIWGRRKGALLIEVLLTMVILGGGLTLIIHSFVKALRASAYSADYSTATSLAEDTMTQYFQQGTIKSGLDETKTFPEPHEKFQYQLMTENKSDGDEKGFLNEVRFIVSWTTGKRDHALTVVTYLPDRVL